MRFQRRDGKSAVVRAGHRRIVSRLNFIGYSGNLTTLYDRNVQTFAVVSVVAGLIMVAADLVFGYAKNTPYEVAVVVLLLICLLASYSRRLVWAVAYAMPLIIVIGASLAFSRGSGIHDPALPVYIAIIILGAFFFGQRGVLIFTCISIVSASVVVAAELLGWYRTPYATTLGSMVSTNVMIAISGVLLWLIMRSLELSLSGEKRAREDLETLYRELERRVSERTNELRRAQGEVLESEKMASLGQLMAGIAHEINSPLGAIQSSCATSADLLPGIVTGIASFAAGLGQGREAELAAFLEAIATQARHMSFVTTFEEQEAMAEAAAAFSSLGLDMNSIQEASRIAARSGVAGIAGIVAPFIAEGRALDALRAAEGLAILSSCLGTIQSSIDRSSRIVFALRAYGQVHVDEPFQELSLVDSIEQALSLFASPLRSGIEIWKEYTFRGGVICRPGNLCQVWVNLIQNAIQAMKGKGKLKIELAQEGGNAVARVVDFGPGIPDDIKLSVFEPFFTTKRLGEGTGLGLDISRRIVKAHGGTISFESRPGRTTFEVRLPLPAKDYTAGCEARTEAD